MRFIKTLTRCWNCWSTQWGVNKYLPSHDGAREVFETTSPEGLAKPCHSPPNASVVALSHSAWDGIHWQSTRTSWTCVCWDTAEKLHRDVTPTSLIRPDYALALPQPRLTDFLSRKPGNKEREWRMFRFHPRHKSWVWSMCLHLWNAGKWSWVPVLLLLCVACYNIYWKHAWILKVAVQEKADILLSLYELVSEWKMWHSEIWVEKGHLVTILQGLSLYFKRVISESSLAIRQWLKNFSLKHWGR